MPANGRWDLIRRLKILIKAATIATRAVGAHRPLLRNLLWSVQVSVL